jgi:hypothetical protein
MSLAQEDRAVLYVGDLSAGSTSMQRFRVFQDLGFFTIGIDSTPHGLRRVQRWTESTSAKLYRIGFSSVGAPDPLALNAQILRHLEASVFRLIWIDKGNRVERSTLQEARRRAPSTPIVGFSLDNMLERHNQSRQFVESLPEYDCFITTKSFAVEPLHRMGCNRVLFVNNSYDRYVHRPAEGYGATYETVGFIGTWEHDRELSIRKLAAAGMPVTVYGNGWHDDVAGVHVKQEAVYGSRYAEAIHSFAVNLCFLRKMNRDLQTTRSVEIPACGGFMLAERSEEHLGLFREGVEAEFFDADAELIDKARYYLGHPEERRRIADAGRRRCVESGYSYHDRIRRVLAELGIQSGAELSSSDRHHSHV